MKSFMYSLKKKFVTYLIFKWFPSEVKRETGTHNFIFRFYDRQRGIEDEIYGKFEELIKLGKQ